MTAVSAILIAFAVLALVPGGRGALARLRTAGLPAVGREHARDRHPRRRRRMTTAHRSAAPAAEHDRQRLARPRRARNCSSSAAARARTSTTRPATATSTACPGCTAASSATPTADEFAEAAEQAAARAVLQPAVVRAPRTPRRIELAERLAALAPDGIEHIFFCGGGAEAVETAWKIARRYHALRGEPGRTKAIARRGAYHGLTLGALSLHRRPRPHRAVRAARRSRPTSSSNTNRFGLARAAGRRGVHRAPARRLEAAILADGPGDRRDAHRRTGAEPGRLHHPARGLLAGPARDWPTGTASCWSPTR